MDSIGGLEEFFIINVPPPQNADPSSSTFSPNLHTATSRSDRQESSLREEKHSYVNWSTNNTKVLIDLYNKHKKRVGTLAIRNLKKLWEIIATELNAIVKNNYSASQCENKWRVLERGYKKYIDNKTKTGRGKKYFEFVEEMDAIFKKKRNVHPELLLDSNTVTPAAEVEEAILENPSSSPPPNINSEPKSKQKVKSTIINRNKIIEQMRQDRREYYKERILIEHEKLEIQKQKLEEIKRRNALIKERNSLLQLSNN